MLRYALSIHHIALTDAQLWYDDLIFLTAILHREGKTPMGQPEFWFNWMKIAALIVGLISVGSQSSVRLGSG